MTDVLTREQRHYCMSRIRGKDTAPELIVRSIIHRLGFRFRIHNRNLPGKPDIILPKYKKVIFVHGCFWHMHKCKYGRVKPATNASFWDTKRKGTVLRDKANIMRLRRDGWDVLIIWECEAYSGDRMQLNLVKFLQSHHKENE